MVNIKQRCFSVFGVSFLCVVLFCIFPTCALSGVVVEDMVVVKGKKVMLRAETRGKIFSKGGELVELFVDGKSIGKTLSGGDGVAYKPFTPARAGLYEIRAKSGSSEAVGLLLSVKRGARVVFVEVESSLVESMFSRKPRQGSQKAIGEIQKGSPIVFLQTGLVSVRSVKKWLEENEFAESPVVRWRQGEIFDEIAEEDLRIKAIVAGEKVIESAGQHSGLALSFKPVEGAEEVQDWQEITEKLK